MPLSHPDMFVPWALGQLPNPAEKWKSTNMILFSLQVSEYVDVI